MQKKERKAVSGFILFLTVMVFLQYLAIPAMAMYHEVYKWDGLNWILVTDSKATVFSEGEDAQQFRFSPLDSGSSVYHSSRAGNPGQFLIENVVQVHSFSNNCFSMHSFSNNSNNCFSNWHCHCSCCYHPWIEVWISESELIWDVFKPGCFMGKAFVIGVKSYFPVQILFGSGTIKIPGGFDLKNHTLIWKDWTRPTTEEYMMENMERKDSLFSNKNKEGTPPDTININYWWYFADEKPDLHEWNPAAEPVPVENNVGPNPDQWKRASDMNSQVITIRNTNVWRCKNVQKWKYLTFFENIKVENSDSEGKYFEQFSITVAPTL